MLNNKGECGENKTDISKKPLVIIEYGDDGWDDLHIEKCNLAALKSVQDQLKLRNQCGVKKMDFIENGYYGLENDVQYLLMQIHDISGVAQELMADQGEEMREKLYTPVFTLVEVLSNKISTVKRYLEILGLRNTHAVVEKVETLRAEGRADRQLANSE